MKKILENIGKSELLEYYRSSSGKFAVGNFVGINNNFAIFTSSVLLEDLKDTGL